jgi:hypothetical protein
VNFFTFPSLFFMIQILNTTSIVTAWNNSIGSLGLPLHFCHIQ